MRVEKPKMALLVLQEGDSHIDSFDIVVFVGDSGCGKTNLLSRFVKGTFLPNTRSTIGVEFASKNIKVKGKKIAQMQVWDTAGQDRYRAITSAYYRNACGAFLVYDISRLATFKALDSWLEELRTYLAPEVPIVVVGNKSDLRHLREVTLEQAKSWCTENCISLYLETSALENTNIDVAFELLTNAMLESLESNDLDVSSNDLIPPKPTGGVVIDASGFYPPGSTTTTTTETSGSSCFCGK